ncbi:uncharacterized protein CCOS01_01376 [Colletotrichum costaricense]|uniref:Uncharacterized protein n=1 Tax=Colletotrichum costaricense TaxID=1209916 RepID=A0AAJ0E707_9PEZI|nr:uncharacterized protein CCOS01_01376 [Colletotrichum costaricense]KAK1540062.1 hypothetical protein CCOS01_01376 [Colletotrichum costaricense]
MYLGWIPRGSPGPSFYLFLSWSTQWKSAHASFLPLSWMMGAGQPLARLVCAELATALAQVQRAKTPVGSCLLHNYMVPCILRPLASKPTYSVYFFQNIQPHLSFIFLPSQSNCSCSP